MGSNYYVFRLPSPGVIFWATSMQELDGLGSLRIVSSEKTHILFVDSEDWTDLTFDRSGFLELTT